MKMPAITPKHRAPLHAVAPVAPAAPGHDHDHGHDGVDRHSHDHEHGHDHAHDHTPPPPRRLPPSLLRMSLAGRLGLAVGLSGLIWVAVAWAVAPIAG